VLYAVPIITLIQIIYRVTIMCFANKKREGGKYFLFCANYQKSGKNIACNVFPTFILHTPQGGSIEFPEICSIGLEKIPPPFLFRSVVVK